jgi:lipopolysaccharide/colanic/teichoic acid biosynthesis glycosyltransferase
MSPRRRKGDEMHLSSAAPTQPGSDLKQRAMRRTLYGGRGYDDLDASEADSAPANAPMTTEPATFDEFPDLPGDIEAGPTSGAKRALDVAVSGLLISSLWPVYALAAALIKLESAGPVLIKQDRIGLNGRGFRFLKFRTMHHNRRGSDMAERLPTGDLTKRLLSPRGRPRHATAIGWTLRQTTVDELPQLINVLKGDMSLVGPRPDVPEIVAAWPEKFRQRHKVKPGMTGLAQVNGRSDLTHYEKVRYDLRYVQDHPITLDLSILIKTVKLVISKKGAR